jgi:intracellular sulfur oxidation DsrE/DsrF family protein
MSMFQHIARVVAIVTIAVLVAASLSAAQEARQPPVPKPKPAATASPKPNTAAQVAKAGAAAQAPSRSASRQMPQPSAAENQEHRLILQVNTNDPAAMNLALNNAMNVSQYYKELGANVEIEIVTFGPGLHMLRDDTSPVKARIEAMALSTPEVSFKACGNTQENMHKAENKDIPIIPQAQVVKSGVVRVMEQEEQGWTYVKP